MFWNTRVRLTLLIFAATFGGTLGYASPDSKPSIVVTARLARIAKPAGCGVFFFGAVAEYTDVKVVRGKFAARRIHVIHGCPELSRDELADGAGSLRTFKIGDRHRLELTDANVLGIEVIVDDGIVGRRRYYAQRTDLASEK